MINLKRLAREVIAHATQCELLDGERPSYYDVEPGGELDRALIETRHYDLVQRVGLRVPRIDIEAFISRAGF